MKTNFFLEEEFSADELALVAKLNEAPEGTNFGELVKLLKLNPALDFINANLRDSDFSNSDVRGFNFSGADLTGVVGTNVKFDSSTNLEGADLDGSLFAWSVSQASYFEQHPAADKQFRILRSSDWLAAAQWFGHHLKIDKDNATRLGFRLFDESEDISVRAQILYYLRHSFEGQDQYRDFLISQIAKPQPAAIVTNCLKILGELFTFNPSVVRVAHLLLDHENEYVRLQALTILMNAYSSYTPDDSMARWMLKEPSALVRRYYLSRVIGHFGPLHDAVAQEGSRNGQYRDFRATVTLDQIQKLAKAMPDNEIDHIDLEPETGEPLKDALAERARLRQLRKERKVRRLFADFNRSGIPFTLEPAPQPNTSVSTR